MAQRLNLKQLAQVNRKTLFQHSKGSHGYPTTKNYLQKIVILVWYITFASKQNYLQKNLKKQAKITQKYTANVIPVKITDNPCTDPCTICVKCKYYRDYLYHDMPVIVI